MSIYNFKTFIADIQKEYPLEGGTNYGKVIQIIRKFYFPRGKGEVAVNLVQLMNQFM